jgi:hypothetical protein
MLTTLTSLASLTSNVDDDCTPPRLHRRVVFHRRAHLPPQKPSKSLVPGTVGYHKLQAPKLRSWKRVFDLAISTCRANCMGPHAPIRSMSARSPMIIPRTVLAYASCMHASSVLDFGCCSASLKVTSLRGIAFPTNNQYGAKCR